MTSNINSEEDLKFKRFSLRCTDVQMPALGFGTLIANKTVVEHAVTTALEVGFRTIDCAERYQNEEEVGQAIKMFTQPCNTRRQDLFIISKLWNTNHRPERVLPAFRASLERLKVDYLDLYLIHTPFASQPGNNFDPRDAQGHVIYDNDVTLLDTWQAMEELVMSGYCKAIGISDVTLEQAQLIFENSRVKPAVIHVEAHPYLPQAELLDFCKKNDIILQAFAPLGHSVEPQLLEDRTIVELAKKLDRTPAQILLAWAIQRGTSALTTSTNAQHIEENFNISRLPYEAMSAIDGITIRHRYNSVTETGVPGFIPRKSSE